MLECLIVGDSIAVGVSQVRPECASIAKSGINSHDWNKKNLHRLQPTRTLIISSLRTNAQADRVFWLLPSQRLKPRQVEAVQLVAREFGDTIIPRPEINISADGVHPTYRGYKILGDQTR